MFRVKGMEMKQDVLQLLNVLLKQITVDLHWFMPKVIWKAMEKKIFPLFCFLWRDELT